MQAQQPRGQRRLVAHILPPQAAGEPSAAEVKERMIRRLQELEREGVGGSALASLLAGLQQQQQQQPAPAGQSGVLGEDVRAVRLLLLWLAPFSARFLSAPQHAGAARQRF
jgi:hypothetical protein